MESVGVSTLGWRRGVRCGPARDVVRRAVVPTRPDIGALCSRPGRLHPSFKYGVDLMQP